MTRLLSEIYETFDSRHVPEPNSGCWIWTGATGGRGYGYMRICRQRMIQAHVFSYSVFVGDTPTGLVLDHTCKNTYCVNPAHLEPVTHRVNILRGVGMGAKFARRTHCSKGHPLSGDNLAKLKENRRRCLICQRATEQRFRDKLKCESL